MTLRVTVISCRDLPVGDFISSDPFVEVSVGRGNVSTVVRRTRTVASKLSPTYDETFHFQGPEVEPEATLRFRVFDKDMFSNDFLARLDVPLKAVTEGKRTEAWYALCAPPPVGDSAPPQGPFGDIHLELELNFTAHQVRKAVRLVRDDERRDDRRLTAARDDEDRSTVSILGNANARVEAGSHLEASTRNEELSKSWRREEDRLTKALEARDRHARFREEQNKATAGRYGFFESCLGDIFTPALIAHVCRLFGKADADGSGTINGTEMVTVVQELYMATGSELPCDDELRKSVRRLHFSFDRDSSGSLSQAEFCTLLRKSPFASALSQRWRTQTNKADSAAPSAHPSPLSSPRVASHQR